MSGNKPFNTSNCFLIFLLFVYTKAQHGEVLLWSSWVEKHPETCLLSAEEPETVTAPWDNQDTKVAWDKHATDTYYSYWERYTYWSAQGWTTDHSEHIGNTGGEKADGMIDRGLLTVSKEQSKGKTRAENHERENKFEALSDLFGQSCTLQTGWSCGTGSEGGTSCGSVADIGGQLEGEFCGSEGPSDGGNDHKRPAATSPQDTAKQTGNIRHCQYCRLLQAHTDCFLQKWYENWSMFL